MSSLFNSKTRVFILRGVRREYLLDSARRECQLCPLQAVIKSHSCGVRPHGTLAKIVRRVKLAMRRGSADAAKYPSPPNRIQISVGIGDEYFWRRWDVVVVAGETVRFRAAGLEEYISRNTW
jgi:hypothetical protein